MPSADCSSLVFRLKPVPIGGGDRSRYPETTAGPAQRPQGTVKRIGPRAVCPYLPSVPECSQRNCIGWRRDGFRGVVAVEVA